MVLFLILLGLLIAIAILLVRYFMAYAKLTSHSAYNKAAHSKMKSLKKKDSNITCDYCGARIDTSIHRVCPNCGAAYGHDEEWTSRYEPNQEFVDDSAREFADEHISKAQEEASKSLKKIKKIFLILVGIFVSLIVLGVIASYFVRQDRYAKDDVLNKYSFDNYVKEDYSFFTDDMSYDSDSLVLYNQNNIKIELTGIYKDIEDGKFKIEYHFINNTSEAKQIKFKGLAINGYIDDFAYDYELVKANDDIIKYAHLYDDYTDIESLIFGEIEVRDEDYNQIDSANDYIVVKTDKYVDTKPLLNQETLIFENDYIGIYKAPYIEDYAEYYIVSIINKSDYDFLVKTSEAKIAETNTMVDIIGLSDDALLAKCVYNNIKIRTYDDIETEAYLNKLLVNYSFSCEKYPEISFSTGFVGVSK